MAKKFFYILSAESFLSLRSCHHPVAFALLTSCNFPYHTTHMFHVFHVGLMFPSTRTHLFLIREPLLTVMLHVRPSHHLTVNTSITRQPCSHHMIENEALVLCIHSYDVVCQQGSFGINTHISFHAEQALQRGRGLCRRCCSPERRHHHQHQQQ